MHRVSTSGSKASPGTMRSITGASQSPARKPRTTLGSAAMISTTGLTYALMSGMHELAHVQRGQQRQGDGEQQRVDVPLRVPKISGVRLNLASKSSVPPVDCHT